MILHVDISVDITSLQVLDYKGNGGEGGIRTLGTGVSPYNGLAIVYSLAMLCNPSYLQVGTRSCLEQPRIAERNRIAAG